MTKISKHCPECDGEDIFQQSYWMWSKERQDWRQDDDDAITCNSCGYSGYKIIDRPITEESEGEDQ